MSGTGSRNQIYIYFITISHNIIEYLVRELPGTPVVKIPHFQSQVRSLVRKLRSHKPPGAAKKKKEIWSMFKFLSKEST